MKKFNGHESFMIQEGLKLYAKRLKEEIQEIEQDPSKGSPFMTQGYVDMAVKELTSKVIDNTTRKDIHNYTGYGDVDHIDGVDEYTTKQSESNLDDANEY
jgi:hypothetical protein